MITATRRVSRVTDGVLPVALLVLSNEAVEVETPVQVSSEAGESSRGHDHHERRPSRASLQVFFCPSDQCSVLSRPLSALT